MSDFYNCGMCGKECRTGEFCGSGQCRCNTPAQQVCGQTQGCCGTTCCSNQGTQICCTYGTPYNGFCCNAATEQCCGNGCCPSGQSCCFGTACCPAGQVCGPSPSTPCVNAGGCGGPGQQCCPNPPFCTATGYICQSGDLGNRCEPCGDLGQVCCPSQPPQPPCKNNYVCNGSTCELGPIGMDGGGMPPPDGFM
jgi:hypothetical protein